MKKLSLVLALTLVFALLALTACSPVDGIKKTLEDNDYTVEVLDNEKIKEKFGEDTKISDALIGTKAPLKIVTVTWFVNEDDAKSYESALKAGGVGDVVSGAIGAEIYRDGKMVATGPKDAIELIK